MRLVTRSVESAKGAEHFLTVTPDGNGGDRPAEMFAAIDRVLEAKGARNCRERVFVPQGQFQEFQEARSQAAHHRPREVLCDWLSAGGRGQVGGVQAYAVRGPTDWHTYTAGGAAALAFRQNGCRWLISGGVTSPQGGEGPEQTRAVFEQGEAPLGQAGMGLHDVARTWLFMHEILGWYGSFNDVRNRLFVERGLLRKGSGDAPLVPASTGMGVTPATGQVALELFAAAGPSAHITRYSASGKQRSAYEYGSAFARAAEMHTPAGRSVFVSGTAAIDASGATCFIDDPKGQIRMTIDNVIAVLRDTNCRPSDVVQAIAYCKTPQVMEIFAAGWKEEVPWPWLTVIGDVCRPDLLFEVEVTACIAEK